MMKKLVAILLLSFLFLTGCVKEKEISDYDKIIERDVLIVGVKDDSAPFGFFDEKTQQFVGFDIDVAKNIALDLLGSERKIKFVRVNSSDRIEKLMSGEVDLLIATMSATPQREYLIDFSKPYFVAGQTVLVKKNSNINTFSDLRHKTTIVVMGSTAERKLRTVIPTARIIGYKTYKEAFDAFKDNKGDAISTDDTIIIGFLAKNKNYRMLKNRISKELYSVGIRKQEESTKLKKSVDSVIVRMHKDGTLKQLKAKWKLI